jgi:hypothetical protein
MGDTAMFALDMEDEHLDDNEMVRSRFFLLLSLFYDVLL